MNQLAAESCDQSGTRMGGHDVTNRRASNTKVKVNDENISTGPSSELSRIFGPKDNPNQQRKKPRRFHPNLKNRPEGQLTASQIWTQLWSRSLSKLVQSDQNFPQDLKETFSAHVRQSIRQFRQPVFRSFTQAEDVSDLEVLMNRSKQEQIQRLRHQTQLMFGSSRINQDRAHILMYNNPLPLVSQGEQDISGFLLPSEDQELVCSEASYMRWLKAGKDTCKTATGQGRNIKDENDDDTQKSSHGLGFTDNTNNNTQKTSSGVGLADSTSIMQENHPSVTLAENTNNTQESFPTLGLTDVPQNKVSSKRREEQRLSACETDKLPDILSPSHRQCIKQPRYHFLTEQEAAVDGAFSHRFCPSRDKTSQSMDLLYWLGHQRSSSAIEPRPQNSPSKHGFSFEKPVLSELMKRKVDDLQRQRSFPQSPWQPLSLTALSEYKKLVPAGGQGPYQQGGARMWQQAV